MILGHNIILEYLIKRHYEIFRNAYKQVSGLGRTVRGPSMSATPGKVLVDGTPTINGKKVISLRFLQGRNPEWVNKPFYAEYDENAIWLDDLKPAFEEKFFFEDELSRKILWCTKTREKLGVNFYS